MPQKNDKRTPFKAQVLKGHPSWFESRKTAEPKSKQQASVAERER